MAFETFEECLEEIEKRYNEKEKVRKKLRKFKDSLEIKFLDTGRSITIDVDGDQGIDINDKTENPDAPVKIEFAEEDTLLKLFNKEIGAVKAYSSGQVKVIEGEIRNLLKMRSLLF